MSKRDTIPELRTGEQGCSGDGLTIEIPAWIIVNLSRIYGTEDRIYSHLGNDPQPELHLFRVIAKLADDIEKIEGKPIANRPRDFSANLILKSRQ